MAGCGFLHGRGLLAANVLCIGAAATEPAAGFRVDRAGQIALHTGARMGTGQLGVRDGNAAQQALGVGVQRGGGLPLDEAPRMICASVPLNSTRARLNT